MSRRKIFVFGSNLEGIHGKGSALYARKMYKAEQGIGDGPTGDAYAIPTRRRDKRTGSFVTIGLPIIEGFVQLFREYATVHPEWDFHVVAIGCGNAGYTPSQMAPMFERMPSNVTLPPEFTNVVYETKDQGRTGADVAGGVHGDDGTEDPGPYLDAP